MRTAGWGRAYGIGLALTRLVFSAVNEPLIRTFRRTITLVAVLVPVSARSQQPVSREQAIEAAVTRGARAAVARADTLIGAAQLLTARSWDNPSLAATYSKAPPNYHAIVDLPLDITGVRGTRVRAAQASRLASQYRFEFERAAAALDADTSYTRALAALERVRLSRRNAKDADSLRRMAVIRRDAGDASELDVLLATVNAGQAANLAIADSVTLISSIFDLQTVMGLDTTRIAIVPSDSLTMPPLTPPNAIPEVALPIAAARQALSAADLSVRVQRRSIFTPFSVQAGVEWGDPGFQGLLPTFGLSIPLPLLNRNRGPIALAEAERERARAGLALALFQTQATIGRARRERAVALEKLQRDRVLVESANRVVAMSLVAYREGAQGLPAVLEAQRNARDILSQYITDLANAWIATATLRLYSLTAPAR
jgi:cobalt-zinc-cadmium efflux system outer membrane protein